MEPDTKPKAHKYPMAAPEVARQEGCALRTVQNWASKNNVPSIGGGNRAQYLFFEEDIARFRLRPKAGRRWPEKS